ncbi:MAG: family 65 glycosyl hydrolase [Clostridiales bacterium 38-18]|nr:MAG: family 65 glycosyl hydrolase [Clostridiales bacterium 38-18]
MSKYADRYYKVEPWRVVEEGFNPEYAQVSESIFSLGNEFMGLRGYFEEGYSGDRLQGSYVNGVYESRKVVKSGYKGMLEDTEFMVNAVDWTKISLVINHVNLDLNEVTFSQFERSLDLKSGLLIRRFNWQVDSQTLVSLKFERLLSMPHYTLGTQKVTIEALKGDIEVELRAYLSFDTLHESLNENFWECPVHKVSENSLQIMGVSKGTHQHLSATCIFDDTGIPTKSLAPNSKEISLVFRKTIKEKGAYALTRIASIDKIEADDASDRIMKAAMQGLSQYSFNQLLAANKAWWENQWEVSDIQIDGDDENQQGIRFCIFQMHQTLHTADHTAVIGAKGLTGEAYNGNTFWDTEVYCLPFYLFNNPEAARSILDFRYNTLPEARERAKALDLKGAFYPIATISGKECCDLWQHANLQLQASTGVMYGIWLYDLLTGDAAYLFDKGAEMLIEISRMLSSRGAYNTRTGEFGFYCVMGPDEFQMMVNQNAYTNFMAQKTFRYTLALLSRMRNEVPDQYQSLVNRLALLEEELENWMQMADKMILLFDEHTKLFEQHEGYFNLPITKLEDIPVEEFPLYSHWAYDRIYRNSMLKQPDVLMFMLLFNSDFSKAVLEANYEFYEPRCIHESSLSPSVHSILAAQLGKEIDAYNFFGFATRMDLDNYNRNTREGLHTTSIAGSWMNIVYGFGGLRSDGALLALSPSIPSAWNSYTFNLNYKGTLIKIHVDQEKVTLCATNPLKLRLYQLEIELDQTAKSYLIERA